jgi:hypothetical protein
MPRTFLAAAGFQRASFGTRGADYDLVAIGYEGCKCVVDAELDNLYHVAQLVDLLESNVAAPKTGGNERL